MSGCVLSAARLQQVTKRGDRVAVLAPQGLDYVISFFAAIYAGTIAVPLFDPDEPGHTDRLHAVLGDCRPSAILTASESAAGVRHFFRALPAAERPRIIAVDAIPDTVGETWVNPEIRVDDIAYLQYTSGSTRAPAGVEITHRAVTTNVLQMVDAIEPGPGIPRSHLAAAVPRHGPADRHPADAGRQVHHHHVARARSSVGRTRWIKELAAMADHAPTFAAAPNFAFEHAALRGRAEGRRDARPEQRHRPHQRQRAGHVRRR